jgi:hypothetical protein
LHRVVAPHEFVGVQSEWPCISAERFIKLGHELCDRFVNERQGFVRGVAGEYRVHRVGTLGSGVGERSCISWLSVDGRVGRFGLDGGTRR